MTPAEGPLLLDLQFPGVVPVDPGRRGDDGSPVADATGLRPLADLSPSTAAEACRIGAMAARTLAEVHRAGVVHGRIGPDAVLVDSAGLPVLRGFASARRTTGDERSDGDARQADVAALRDLLVDLVRSADRPVDGREVRHRRRVVRSLRHRDDLDAVDLSDRLAGVVRRLELDGTAPTGTGNSTEPTDEPLPATIDLLDRPSPQATERSLRARVRARPTGPSRASLVGLATGSVAVVALVLGLMLRSGSGTPPTGPTVVDPAGVPGAPEVAVAGFAYRVGLPGDVAVVRDCAGVPSVWLLRPSTGALYRFDDLAGADPVSTAPLRYAPGATGLSVHRVLDCDHVHLELPGDAHLEVAD